ncbi:ATP-dependent DNA helicase PIF1-like [Hydra vulgaris]|uniref:ATP-dependent DNA helicase PIF1-like n=1 Tax=Hydra vulgaris TaxID=6087 RepID=UPI0032E9D568
MRVHDGEREISNWLLRLGSGTVFVKEEDLFKGCIEIPHQCLFRENDSIVEKIFGDAEQNNYAKRVILTPTNVDSLSIIVEVLQRLPGEVKTYLSANQVETDKLNERNNFPVEFLNSLIPSGMPFHTLKFKIGCIIMLFRNLDLKAGIYNGTRMKVCALQNNYIDAEVLTGVSAGKRVFVSRIQLAPSGSSLPFVLKRRQFPVRLAYSMTINKSQGQTFERVSVYLKKPCLTHGQLYVACSRTRAFNSLFFKINKHPIQGMIDEKCYTNIVAFSNVLKL